MDEFVKRIQDERAKLQREAEEIQRKIDALAQCEEIFKGEPDQKTKPQTVPQLLPAKKIDLSSHADTAEKILHERGPLTAREIARLFTDEGKKTTPGSLGTILSREKGKRFDRTADGKWKLHTAGKGAGKK